MHVNLLSSVCRSGDLKMLTANIATHAYSAGRPKDPHPYKIPHYRNSYHMEHVMVLTDVTSTIDIDAFHNYMHIKFA